MNLFGRNAELRRIVEFVTGGVHTLTEADDQGAWPRNSRRRWRACTHTWTREQR